MTTFDSALVFNVSVINHENLSVMVAFPDKLSENEVTNFASNFQDAIKATRFVGTKMTGVEWSVDKTCTLADKEIGIVASLSGPQVNHPWFMAAVILSLQLAYREVTKVNRSSRIYIDQILSPDDVKRWKKNICQEFLGEDLP